MDNRRSGGSEGLAPVAVAHEDQRVRRLHKARQDEEGTEPVGGLEQYQGDNHRGEGQAPGGKVPGVEFGCRRETK